MNFNHHLLKLQVQNHLSQLRSQASVQTSSLKPVSEPQL
jgi:hypothetical protein